MFHSQKSKLLIFIFHKKNLLVKKTTLVSGDLTINPAEDPEQGFWGWLADGLKQRFHFICGLKYCTMQGFSTFWYCSKGYNASLYWRNAAASWHYNKSLTSTWVIIVTFFAHFYSGYHRFFSWARVAICFGVLGVVTCNHNDWFLRHSLLLKTESLDDVILELWLA